VEKQRPERERGKEGERERESRERRERERRERERRERERRETTGYEPFDRENEREKGGGRGSERESDLQNPRAAGLIIKRCEPAISWGETRDSKLHSAPCTLHPTHTHTNTHIYIYIYIGEG